MDQMLFSMDELPPIESCEQEPKQSHNEQQCKDCAPERPLVWPESIDGIKGLKGFKFSVKRMQVAVYFLCSRTKVVYIGESRELRRRIGKHLYEDRIPFVRAAWLQCEGVDRRAIEKALIRYIQPQYNQCGLAEYSRTSTTADVRILTELYGRVPPGIRMRTGRNSMVFENATNQFASSLTKVAVYFGVGTKTVDRWKAAGAPLDSAPYDLQAIADWRANR